MRIAALLLLATLLGGCVARSGAEVRVGFDRSGVTSAHADGYADARTKRRLTIDDPVRIASVSKLVVGLGVMRLVEAGVLDLDRDVSDVLGWRLRHPAHPDVPITLRLLLSHRAALRDGIDYALPLGAELRAALAQRDAWGEQPPGAYFRYANLGFPVIASAMERATGERFDLLMQRLVFDPLKLDACFNWPTCSDAAVARAVVLTDGKGAVLRDDLRGRRPDCPVVPASDGGCDLSTWRPGANGALFSPQGGLRISARGLAAIGRMLLNDGAYDGARFLSPASIATLTTPVWRFAGDNGDSEGGFYCAYGLAVQILAACAPGDDLFGDGRARVGHAGEAYGLRSGLWLDRDRGTGVAYYVTAISDDASKGRSAYTQPKSEWRVEPTLPAGASSKRRSGTASHPVPMLRSGQ